MKRIRVLVLHRKAYVCKVKFRLQLAVEAPDSIELVYRSIDTPDNRLNYERRNIAPQVRASCYDRAAENSTSDGYNGVITVDTISFIYGKHYVVY